MAVGSTPTSKRNQYEKYFLRVKGCRCVGLTILPPSCAYCLKIWELQTPGTLGPVQACTGIGLLLLYLFNYTKTQGDV